MAKQIRVTLEPHDLDDWKTLQEALEQETSVPWQVTEIPDDEHLTDIWTIVLTGFIGASMKQAMEVTWPYAEDGVRKVVAWYKERFLDPPEIKIEVIETPEDSADEGGSPDNPDPLG